MAEEVEETLHADVRVGELELLNSRARGVTPHHITSHHVASHSITSQHTASHHITSHRIASHHITSHHNTSHRIAPHHTTHHTTHRIASHRTASHHNTSHNTSHRTASARSTHQNRHGSKQCTVRTTRGWQERLQTLAMSAMASSGRVLFLRRTKCTKERSHIRFRSHTNCATAVTSVVLPNPASPYTFTRRALPFGPPEKRALQSSNIWRLRPTKGGCTHRYCGTNALSKCLRPREPRPEEGAKNGRVSSEDADHITYVK